MLRSSAFVSFFLVSLAGCGAGKVGEAVKPADPTAAEALKEPASVAQCHQVGPDGSPLIVDWKAQDRGELEATMADHVAVVHYDCTSLKLLPDCKVQSSAGYGYVAVTSKEENIQLENADDAQANLPFSGGKIGAQMTRGSSLNIQLITVGKRSSANVDVYRTDLGDHCEGATHFVRGAWLGAFTLATGANGKVGAQAAVAGLGASGSSSADRKTLNSDGSVDACKASELGAKQPPSNCGAPFRMILSAISDGSPRSGTAKKDAPRIVEQSGCPTGLVYTGGRCTTARPNIAHECRADDAADCDAQCTAGNAPSCTKLGRLTDPFYAEQEAKWNDKKSVAAYQKACTGGHQLGCTLLADKMMNGDGGLKEDDAGALKLDTTACDAGEAHGCDKAAFFYDQGIGVKDDAPKARAFWDRACRGGIPGSCLKLSSAYSMGDKTLKADKAKAVDYRIRGCLAGSSGMCGSLAKAYEKGDRDDAITPNPTRASAFHKLACRYGSASDCAAK